MNEITFIITEDDVDGGYSARAHWPDGNRDIFTEGDTREDLIRNIREALDVTFPCPCTIPLKIGTLANMLDSVSTHLQMTREQLLRSMKV